VGSDESAPRIPKLNAESIPQILSRTRTVALVACALCLVIVLGALGYQFSLRQGMATMQSNASHRLDLFASAVESMLNRLEHVPATIQLNRDVIALLDPSGNGERTVAVNAYLRELNAQLGSMAVYVINPRGIVVAASNSTERSSFMGEDLSFRPYFTDALSGKVGRHFAIGNTSGQPGYFLSNPIRDGRRVVGVAVIKISLAPIQQAWAMLGVPAMIADENHVVILSSQPEWLYSTLTAPSLEQRVQWQITQRYRQMNLSRLPMSPGLTEADLNDPKMQQGQVRSSKGLGLHDVGSALLLQVMPLSKMQWQLLTLSDLSAVRKQAVLVSLLSCVAAAFLCLLWVVFNQRHRLNLQKLQAKQQLEEANARLEDMVALRTLALIDANDRLRQEVRERVQAEQTLRKAQDELVQAAKLAVLGQLATGITHELAQPLGAIRTLTSNTVEFLKRGTLGTVKSNLMVMARLADQMGIIVHQLKGFARKSPAMASSTDVAQTVSNALLLFAARLRTENITLHNHCKEGLCVAWCDANRLEQVVLNLIGNALDAMRESDSRILTIEAQMQADGASLSLMISDTGSGIAEALMPRLFDAFVTTKPVGIGLGLGLAISRDIVREFHGELRAHNRPEGGACFVVQLPASDPPPILPSNP
jgi:C4-dicarboxylate-specific signal transduction histidine kinase